MQQPLQIAEALALILVLLFLVTAVMDIYDLIKTVSLATVFILQEILGQTAQQIYKALQSLDIQVV